MSVKINVDPARLEASASHIEQMYMNYEREYRRFVSRCSNDGK